jgi:hypothetical protein
VHARTPLRTRCLSGSPRLKVLAMKPSSGESGSNKSARLSAAAATGFPLPLGPDGSADVPMPHAGAPGGSAWCAEDDDEDEDEAAPEQGAGGGGAEAPGAAAGESEAAHEDDDGRTDDGDTEDGRDRVRLGSAARRCGDRGVARQRCARRGRLSEPGWRRTRNALLRSRERICGAPRPTPHRVRQERATAAHGEPREERTARPGGAPRTAWRRPAHLAWLPRACTAEPQIKYLAPRCAEPPPLPPRLTRFPRAILSVPHRDGLEGYVAALTSGRSFGSAAAPAAASPAAYLVHVLDAAAHAPHAALPPPSLGLTPAQLSSIPGLCRSRRVLELPHVSISHAHASARWPWMPGLGPARPRSTHGNAAVEASEHAVRCAVLSAFRESQPDVVLWVVAMDCGIVRWVSDNVAQALGHPPSALLGFPYMADGHVEDNIKYLGELQLLLETQGELRCMPRRLFRRRHAFGHEVLVSCCGSVFMQDPVTGEFVGIVANRIVAALHS